MEFKSRLRPNVTSDAQSPPSISMPQHRVRSFVLTFTPVSSFAGGR